MILFFKLNVIIDENFNFIFYCQTAFIFINTEFFFSISFFEFKIFNEHILRKKV